MNNITYVTALLDINRSDLKSNAFKRSFNRYIETLSHLLRHLKDKKLVIYIEKENENLVKSIKAHDIIIKYITCDDLRKSQYYDKIQKIRLNEEWRNQAGWLTESTQANLELYNPLIFNKIHWLSDIANENPFDTEYFVWIDAGIANAQCNPGYFSKSWFEERICPHLEKFLLLCFPYENYNEIHGFTKEGMVKYSRTNDVNRVARATFFGGKKAECSFFADKFREIAHETLNAGYMGTEESILTILSYLYNDIVNIQMIKPNGLVSYFFENLQNHTQKVFTVGGFDYLNTRVQQHPNTFDVFKNFLDTNTNIDLIIEFGTGSGGFSIFLHDECKKHNIKFITYDLIKQSSVQNNDEFVKRNIDFRQKDVLNEDTILEIKNLISSHKKTLIMCDGGNTAKEFDTYCTYLKLGDIIMAHDYAPNIEVFNSKYKNKIWNWMEIQDKDIESSVKKYKLKDYYKKFEEIAWVCKSKSFHTKVDLYIVTFNSPKQFQDTVEKIIKASPDLYENSCRYVINNSTDSQYDIDYSKLFITYNFTEFKKDNIGICGARQFIAEHFDATENEYMVFFEDDMGMNGPDDKCEKCKNGFSKYHPTLYNDIISIMEKEDYDYLKLSFTEFFGDNSTQWSWYNVPQNVREKLWPDKPKLPTIGLDKNPPLCKFNSIKSHNGLPYADGEIYYCNWPQIVSKNGNKKMFLTTKWKHPYEQTWMSYIYQQTIINNIKTATLLLSPITHNRFDHYDKKLRKEN